MSDLPQRFDQFVSKTSPTSIALYPGDKELLLWLAEYLGSNQSDACRTAIRHMAVHLKAIQGVK